MSKNIQLVDHLIIIPMMAGIVLLITICIIKFLFNLNKESYVGTGYDFGCNRICD